MTDSTISITGNSVREMDNDVLSISFAVTVESKDSNEVQTQMRQAVHAALQTVRPYLKVGEVDVQSDVFRVQPRYAKTNQKIDGYVGNASITVKGTDTATISKIASEITTMVVAGSTNSMSRKQRTSVEAELTQEAIADFRAKADAAAFGFNAKGWTVGEVSIDVRDNTPRFGKMMMGASASDESAPMAVEGGKSEVSVYVRGTIVLGKAARPAKK